MEGMHYEGIIIRPPSEANSIIIQVTVGCSHNKCTFCGTYKGVRFRIKDEQTIISDIRYAARHYPFLKRVFLTDGDALIVPQRRLIRILATIREEMPWIERVGLYGNAKSILRKSVEELRVLKELGLGIIYLGVESGDEEVLRAIRKGASPQAMIEAGRKVIASGIKLSVTVLLGIAGRRDSLRHARATGEVLSAIDPDYVGALTLMILPNTELGKKYLRREFELPGPYEILEELREMVYHTHMDGLFVSNHASNYLPLRIRMPDEKEKALAVINAALAGAVDLRPEWARAL